MAILLLLVFYQCISASNGYFAVGGILSMYYEELF